MPTVHPYIELATNWNSGDDAPAARYWPGGDGYVAVQGTLGSATAQLKWAGPKDVAADDDGDLDNEVSPSLSVGTALSAEGLSTFSAPPGMLVAAMTGSGGSGIYVAVYPKPVKGFE